MSALNSYGAILTYAIDLEGQLRDYYTACGDMERAEISEKRRVKLERVRRENVVEITLEPIEGLDSSDYALPVDDTSVGRRAVVEQVAARFYGDVAPKINVRQAQRALEKCGAEHAALAGG